MAKRKIFIVTNRKEQEVDGVIDFLRDQEIDIIRWNLCRFPEKESYTTTSSALLFPMVNGKIRSPSAGWLHHFGPFSTERSLTGLEREVSLKETRSYVEGILSSLMCTWFNKPSSIASASNKLYQLITANRLKIPIPNFILSNDKRQVKEFTSKYPFILKSLATGFIPYGDLSFKVYTKKFIKLPKAILSALKYGPVIVQQAIAKKKEFRVTVVDNKCFSVEVDYTHKPQTTDVRELIRENNRHLFIRAKNIQKIEEVSLKLTRYFGLRYAGLDWILSKEGKYYFLELNPLGSFKWYEQCGNFDITSAIGKALMTRL